LTHVDSPSVNLSGNRNHKIYNSDGKLDGNHSWVFKMEDITELGLTRGGLILVGLLSGGDYHSGLDRCGIKTAVALAQCGFGDSLYQAALNLEGKQLADFLDNWRHEVKHELKTNSRNIIGKKFVALANSLPSSFPSIEVLNSYVNPVTSASLGRPFNPGDIRWDKEPDISKIAQTCEQYFEWGYREAIVKRFRTVIWPGAVLRILRRAVVNDDAQKRGQAFPPSTPSSRRIRNVEASGTPSKMITKYFSTLAINDDDEEDDESERLITKIHSKRSHASTDGVPEYRLEVNPAQLVRLAESGLLGTRQAIGPNEWASDEEGIKDDDDDEGGGGKGKKKKEPVDPLSSERLWLPACMVEIVEPRLVQAFEDEAERKRLKKANKGQGRKKKTTADTDTSPKRKRTAKKKAPAAIPEEEEEGSDDDALPTFSLPKPKSKSKPTASTSRLPIDESDSDSDLGIIMPPLAKPISRAPAALPHNLVADDPLDTPSARRRAGVRDLTKKKQATKKGLDALSSTNNLTSFFPAKKPGTQTDVFNSKAKATSTVGAGSSKTSPSTSKGPSNGPAPFPLALETFCAVHDMDTDDEIMVAPYRLPSPTISKPGPSRRQRAKSPSSSGSESRVHKSPRKSRAHTTPLSDRSRSASASTSVTPPSEGGRSGSPVPVHSPRKGKTTLISLKTKPKTIVDLASLPVIEISSDEEDEDEGAIVPPAKPSASQPLPRKPTAAKPSTSAVKSQKKVSKAPAASQVQEPETPPLLRARKKAGRLPPANVIAVIDLT
jgi:holliday junction resolvase YEN1